MATYNSERMLLAKECAEALNLKQISPILEEYGVKISDLPYENMMGDTNLRNIRKETSLLSMGVVYSYNGMLKFVDTVGHTYLMPYHPVIIEELEKCGYIICEYGKSSPNFNKGKAEEITDFDIELLEKETKEKATLPLELAEKVSSQEQIQLEKDITLPYDVFNYKYYDAPEHYGFKEDEIIQRLGCGNQTARKFMALIGYRGTNLSSVTKNATSPELFVLYADKHPIINDDLYFAPNGLYNELIAEQKKQEEQKLQEELDRKLR